MTHALVDTNVLLRYLLRDDERKFAGCERLLNAAKRREIHLILPPIVAFEIVWILEKAYKYPKSAIRETMEIILNTPELNCEMKDVLLLAVEIYERRNVKFADAVIAAWGRDREIGVIYTYDEKDFKRVEWLEVRKP
ncbi:MAG: PIN domain-containing protein [Nitrospinae bacterium]|nr:PIN domain-containing protein [Nitrospinota bacterium]